MHVHLLHWEYFPFMMTPFPSTLVCENSFIFVHASLRSTPLFRRTNHTIISFLASRFHVSIFSCAV